MKIVFTFFILFACLKLSAAVPNIDTGKLSIAKGVAGTQKVTSAPPRSDSVNLKVSSEHRDTLKQTAPVLNKDGSVFLAQLRIKDSSLTQTAPIVKKDSSLTASATNHPESDKPATVTNKGNAASVAPVEVDDKLPPISSLLQLDSLKEALVQEQARQAALRRLILQNEQVKLAQVLKINNLDSLKQQLKVTSSDTVKALIYTRIAQKYLDYDTISGADKQLHFQNAAISYTLLAIREYSGYSDSTGLRDAYATLAKVYYSQKKYTQAKWFILQANTLSRAKKDTPNIISSLLTLATIKSSIKDYTLAMSDLDDALQLSITNHTPKTELEVLKEYAFLYNTLQNYPKEAAVLKQRDALLDSIRKSEEAELARAAAQKKKLDRLNKKKLLLAGTRKPFKNNSQAKIASL